MRGFTKEEAEQHQDSLKEMFEKTEERLDVMCEKFASTYVEALVYKLQRDELLTLAESLIEDYEEGRTLQYSIEAFSRTIESINSQGLEEEREWKYYHG